MKKARLALIGTMAAVAVLGTTALANGTRLVVFYNEARTPVETAAMFQEKVMPSGDPVLEIGETLQRAQIPYAVEIHQKMDEKTHDDK